MKATDLMIGDYVKWKNKYVQVASNSGIVWSFGHIDVTLAYCNDEHLLESHDLKSISPIPLTPEILEKNGFKWHNGLTFIHPDSKFFVPVPDSRVTVTAFNMNVTFYYVHELQHALRLCGLNDLADNFKV